ncbi:MAG: Coenzyme F420 hydrogenase/dehydrogenase, beta subunit C-terminal domain [Candidatus Cryptobacteroides sp.]
MITIADKRTCCGCGACVAVCPRQCITMYPDVEGFLYPEVERGSCIDCGLCEKVCHELHPSEERTPLRFLAAINDDEPVRLRSSSGGIFHLLASKTVSEGGVVFGARFDEHWQVVIDYAETMDGVEAFLGSKYVQARTGTAYADAMRFLRQGRKVLFSGTPCQVAGLNHFLRKPYDNLLTFDIICHGTPSPKVWGLYLDEIVANGRRAIRDTQFRNKSRGWKRFNFTMAYNRDDETVSLTSHYRQNHFMRAFIRDMILRPSCHDCKAKCGRSHSDITIADFWGVESEMPDVFDDKGTGLVMLNTDKALDAIDWSRATHRETTLESALRHNPAWSVSFPPHPKREFFFSRVDSCHSLGNLIDCCLRPSPKQRWKTFIHSCKLFVKRVLKGKACIKDFGTDMKQPLPEASEPVSIRFRNKDNGWTDYKMEIRLK